jgi:hypothetical protein
MAPCPSQLACRERKGLRVFEGPLWVQGKLAGWSVCHELVNFARRYLAFH